MSRHLRIVQSQAEQAKAELAELEATIDTALRTSFVEIGQALTRIRNGGLYKSAGFATFEGYCRTSWEMTTRYAEYQIKAAATVGLLEANNCSLPSNEAQVRQLTRLPIERRTEAWKEAVDTAPSGKVTAAHVASVVAAKLPPKPSKPPAPTPVVRVTTPIESADGDPVADRRIACVLPMAQALTALLDRYEREAREHQARSDDAFRRAQTAPMRSLSHKKQTCSDLRREALDDAIHARLFRQFARDLRAAIGLPPDPEMAEPRDDDDDENGGAR